MNHARLLATGILLSSILAALGYGIVRIAGEMAENNIEQSMTGGGYVIYLRHADRGRGEKEIFTAQSPLAEFNDCSSQRNLTAEGREDATQIGITLRQMKIPIGEVFAIPLCRTRETATLAFGKARLDPRFYDPAFVAALLARMPASGTNNVLVASDYQARAVAGIDLKMGEAAIFQPDGKGGFNYRGHLDRDDLMP